jgi:hypothetical protein
MHFQQNIVNSQCGPFFVLHLWFSTTFLQDVFFVCLPITWLLFPFTFEYATETQYTCTLSLTHYRNLMKLVGKLCITIVHIASVYGPTWTSVRLTLFFVLIFAMVLFFGLFGLCFLVPYFVFTRNLCGFISHSIIVSFLIMGIRQKFCELQLIVICIGLY